MNAARPYVPTSASTLATASGGNRTGTICILSGGRPIGRAVAGDCAAGKKTMPFSVDALNDADYINGIVYGGKAMTKLTDAGREMIALFLAREGDRGGLIRATDGQMYMTLPKGEGAAKATLEKLKRDGLAVGRWNTYGTSIVRPTDAGREAYATCGLISLYRVGDQMRVAGREHTCGFIRSVHKDARGIYYIIGMGGGKHQARSMYREESIAPFDRRLVA